MEPRNYPQEDFGALQGCLVEGDPEERTRERRIHRWSLAISVLLQAAALVVVVLVPLLTKTERIALANVTPVPPYSPYRQVASTSPGNRVTAPTKACIVCFSGIPPTIATRNSSPGGDSNDPHFDGPSFGLPRNPDGIDVFDPRAHKPQRPDGPVEKPRTVHVASIDPAMLRNRVDPVYPALARQIHREGRVEIRAIIGDDGTMQSLQVVGGDPMFYNSALEAVQQWLYKPTYLNGQPVQVDTTITVIYSMQR